MRRVVVVLVWVLAGGCAVASGRSAHRPDTPSAPDPTVDLAWSSLDAQARCDSALALITSPDRWPILCRWRQPGETVAGQSFPPPPGAPPYDNPHVEIYVSPTQSRESVARTIAHELGHMHHTREATFVSDWLAARNLDPKTPPEVWTEDYAEVFAALFGPPFDDWRAPTPRPSPDALASLKARFFS